MGASIVLLYPYRRVVFVSGGHMSCEHLSKATLLYDLTQDKLLIMGCDVSGRNIKTIGLKLGCSCGDGIQVLRSFQGVLDSRQSRGGKSCRLKHFRIQKNRSSWHLTFLET